MVIKRFKTYNAVPRENTSLDCKSGATFNFEKGVEYLTKFLILGSAQIIINKTKITVNGSWIFKNFDLKEVVKSETI
jgi:hypothetical protein